MARRLIPLAVLALALFLVAAPASVARAPGQKIVKRQADLGPGQTLSFLVTCPPGYHAVAAAVVYRDPFVREFSIRRVTERSWGVSATNFDRGNSGSLLVEVKCVRLGPVDIDHEALNIALDNFERRREEEARSRRGYAPIGTGFSYFPPGGSPGDPPPEDAFIHTFDSRFVPGGFHTGLVSTGEEAVNAELGFLSIDRVTAAGGGASASARAQGTRTARRVYRQTVLREDIALDAPPQTPVVVNGRCPRGSVATGLGFDTPDDKFVRVAPTGWTGKRLFHFVVVNFQDTAQAVEAQGLCLKQTVRRR